MAVYSPRLRNHSRRRWLVLGMLLVVSILVFLNISTSYRTIISGRHNVFTGIRLKSYTSERLSDLLDQLFYQPESAAENATESSGHDDHDGRRAEGYASMSINHAKDAAHGGGESNSIIAEVAVGSDEESEEAGMLKAHNHKWRFGENVVAELSVHRDEMVAQGEAFGAFVAELAGGGMKGGRKSGAQKQQEQQCAYLEAGTKLKRHDYSHRQKRAHEYRTEEYHAFIKKTIGGRPYHQPPIEEAGAGNEDGGGQQQHNGGDTTMFDQTSGAAMWVFSPRIPTVLNHFPIALADSPKLNISVPFGSWKSVFYPVDDFVAQHQEAPLPSYLRPPQVLEAAPPLYAAVVRNALLAQGHLVTCSGDVLTSGGCLWEFSTKASPDHAHKARHVAIGIPLCDKWCNGFYHFTHEHLPRLALVHAMLTDPKSKAMLVLSHSTTGFQRGFLFDVLGIPKNRVLSAVHAIADYGVYPMPQRCGNTFTHLLHMMRAIVHKRLHLSPATNVTFDGVTGRRKPHLLFAERSHLSRMPRNFYELKAQLMVDYKDRLSFDATNGASGPRDQIGRFYRADIVLGPHGANLANMMWMRQGMHVIEMGAAANGNMCYYATAGRVGLVHHLLLHGAGKDGHYNLTYALFRKHVEAALRAVEESIKEEMLLNDVTHGAGAG